MKHQHSLRRQGWNTSPAEVNYKSSSKANLLDNNKPYWNIILIQVESDRIIGSADRIIQIESLVLLSPFLLALLVEVKPSIGMLLMYFFKKFRV